MIIQEIKNCSRCGGIHNELIRQSFSGEKNPHYTHFAICPTTNEPILIKTIGEEVTIYRKCWKCGRSAEIITTDPDKPLMCTSPMPVRISGICGGSYTEPYAKEEFEKEREEFLKK